MQRSHRLAHFRLWLLLVPLLLALIYFAGLAAPRFPVAEPAPEAGQATLP